VRAFGTGTSEPAGYLYPPAIFAPIELPKSAQQARIAASG